MWHLIILDSEHSYTEKPSLDGTLKIVAHNLTQAEAKAWEQPTILGQHSFVLEYEKRHDVETVEECSQCSKIRLGLVKEKLRLGEEEAANRGKQILEKNFGNPD